MTPLFPAQRAAEEFDQALDGTARPAVSERYDELLDTVVVLQSQPEVLPRAEFAGDLRTRLMTAAETELVAAPPVVRQLRPVRNRRRIGTVAASLVIVGGSTGMAAAASSAIPGDPLYPIKRGMEQAGTAVRFGDAGKGEALLNQADSRLDEVRDLHAQGSPDAELVASTLDSFNSAAESGSARLFAAYATDGDAQDIVTVREFTADQMNQIDTLSGTSATTDELLLDAADTLADIDTRARALCATCGSAEPLAPVGALSSGAGAATVDNLLSRPVAQAQADITKAEAQRIARLKAAAEETAEGIPKGGLGDLGSLGTDGLAAGLDGDGPVSSTLTPDGKLPASSGGTAVKDLVSGVTGGIDDVASSGDQPDSPVGSAVDDLTDPVDGLTNDLIP